MTRHQVSITSNGHPNSHRVELDGQDISTALRGASLTIEAGHVPQVELDLTVVELTTYSGEADVHLAPGVGELLQRFGWTPPEGDDL